MVDWVFGDTSKTCKFSLTLFLYPKLMKQLALIPNKTISKKEIKMLEDYWAIEENNRIEIFVLTNNEFLKKYIDTGYFSNLRNIEILAIYQVEECNVCLNSFNIVINDRAHLESYSQSKNKCCRVCGHFQSSIENSKQ